MSAGWSWIALGKHPTASDFIRLGARDATVLALWDWVEGGFNRFLAGHSAPPPSVLSYRWWAAGAGDGLRYGLLRASCDRIGRPYPLLIAGSGTLAGWRRQWNLLPLACEAGWNRMETLAAGGHRDLSALERKLLELPPPASDWAALQVPRPAGMNAGRAAPAAALAPFSAAPGGASAEEPADRVLRLLLPRFGNADPARLISDYCGQWRLQQREVPTLVWVGGSAEAARLIFFLRPLVSGDFALLWEPMPRP